MIPDRFQPRRLLPTLLRQAYFSGEITCYQAAEEWLKLSRQNEGYKTETDRLLAMGDSFDQAWSDQAYHRFLATCAGW